MALSLRKRYSKLTKRVREVNLDINNMKNKSDEYKEKEDIFLINEYKKEQKKNLEARAELMKKYKVKNKEDDVVNPLQNNQINQEEVRMIDDDKDESKSSDSNETPKNDLKKKRKMMVQYADLDHDIKVLEMETSTGAELEEVIDQFEVGYKSNVMNKVIKTVKKNEKTINNKKRKLEKIKKDLNIKNDEEEKSMLEESKFYRIEQRTLKNLNILYSHLSNVAETVESQKDLRTNAKEAKSNSFLFY